MGALMLTDFVAVDGRRGRPGLPSFDFFSVFLTTISYSSIASHMWLRDRSRQGLSQRRNVFTEFLSPSVSVSSEVIPL